MTKRIVTNLVKQGMKELGEERTEERIRLYLERASDILSYQMKEQLTKLRGEKSIIKSLNKKFVMENDVRTYWDEDLDCIVYCFPCVYSPKFVFDKEITASQKKKLRRDILICFCVNDRKLEDIQVRNLDYSLFEHYHNGCDGDDHQDNCWGDYDYNIPYGEVSLRELMIIKDRIQLLFETITDSLMIDDPEGLPSVEDIVVKEGSSNRMIWNDEDEDDEYD